jgi:RNA polymerase sigma factor (sigma-70 family)
MVDRDLVALAERKQVPLDHIPIERLVFPRAWNRLLREAGIDTVGQLCQASEVVLQARLPRGDRTVGHMRQRLENYLPWLVEQRSWDSEVLQQGASPVFRTELAETSLDQMLAEFLDCLHTDRQQVVIRLRWGLNQAEPKTLEETGKSIGVTRERVRQIQDRATRQLRRPSNRMVIELLLEMLQEILVQAGGLAATQYLAETLERTVGIVNVNTRNAVRFLCSVDSRFIALRKDTWGLKGYPLHRVQDINRVMVDILEDKHGFAPRPEILAEFRTTELHEELGGHVTNGFLDACLDSNPGIEISADGECALKRRASARLHSMVKALRNIGRPAHYSEIAREVNELLPERQRAPTHAIHAHMGRLPDIFVRCGRGVFGLAEWGLHQDRSLADAAYRVLAEIGRPLHVERIIDNVLDTWRVERTSVYAAIQSDDRFYRVGEGVYWLRDRIGQTEGKKGKGRGFGEVYGASLLERQETLEAWQGRESIDTHDEVEKIRRIGSGLFDSKRKSR